MFYSSTFIVQMSQHIDRLLLLALLSLICTKSAVISWELKEQQQQQQQVDQRLKLGVFYESRCPDSKRFIVNQLLPVYGKLEEIIDLQLVPFGHARIISKDKMICQHGSRECEGNRLMACVETYGKANMTAVVSTIACLFETTSSSDCIKTNLSGVSYDEIVKCKNGDESFGMMEKFEKITGRVSYIPHLTLNGTHSEEIQRNLEFNLKGYLCKSYEGQMKPEACKVATTKEATTSELPAFY